MRQSQEEVRAELSSAEWARFVYVKRNRKMTPCWVET